MDHDRLNEYMTAVERLRGGAIARLSWEDVYQLLDRLTEDLPLVIQPLPSTAKFARGRVLGTPERFTTTDTLWHPPGEWCSLGRCNKKNEPMLYAGVGTELVFSEIGARKGDVVGLLHLSPIEKIYCVHIGAAELWRRTSGECHLSPEIKKRLAEIHSEPSNIVAFLLDALVSDFYSQPGLPDVYKFTSAYASVVSNAHPQIAGLIYNSVDHLSGACLAFRPAAANEQLRPTDVQIVRITEYLGYGIFDFEEIARSSTFHDRTIVW